MQDCIFCKIGSGAIPSAMLYKDDHCFVIRDIHPLAPTHLLVIPFQHSASLEQEAWATEPLLGHLMAVAAQQARWVGVDASGYRLVVNQGPDSGQAITHVHVHVLGGKPLPELG